MSRPTRLLDTTTGDFVVPDPSESFTSRQPYAILSYVWDSRGEQSYAETRTLQELCCRSTESDSPTAFSEAAPRPSAPLASSCLDHPRMSKKIRQACAIAKAHGYRYIWIDSCCIDKTSSAELSEAVNSMFTWYRNASVCYAYLEDVSSTSSPRANLSGFRTSRWFSRGWTLQELIAPREVVFLSVDWQIIGTKNSLVDVTESITGIPSSVLLHLTPLHEVCVARRMSWASKRQTTRVEDEAYSLMGIFDINMPTLYGEGRRAFHRLQEEILKRIPDETLFAWGPRVAQARLAPTSRPKHGQCGGGQSELDDFFRYEPHFVASASNSSFLAPSVSQFEHSDDVCSISQDELASRLMLHTHHSCPDYSTSSQGVHTRLPLFPFDHLPMYKEIHSSVTISSRRYLALLACRLADGSLITAVCYSAAYTQHDVKSIGLHCGIVSCFSQSAQGILDARLVVLSPDDLHAVRTKLHWNEVYLNSGYFQKMPSGPAFDNRTVREHLHLTPWSRNALRDAGYTLAIVRPLPARREPGNTYSLIITPNTEQYVDIKIQTWGVPPHVVENWLKSDLMAGLVERTSLARLHLLAVVEAENNTVQRGPLTEPHKPVMGRSAPFCQPSGNMRSVRVSVTYTSTLYLLDIAIE